MPSPEGRSLRKLPRTKQATSPSAKVLETIMAEAKIFKDKIDISKSKEEIRLERQMERNLKAEE